MRKQPIKKTKNILAYSLNRNLATDATFKNVFLPNALKQVPLFNKKIKSAIEHTVLCIHGLDDFHTNVNRDNLEIYLGRATVSTLISRWSKHESDKQHEYGMILFQSEFEFVNNLEEIAIRIIKTLKNRNQLCVYDLSNYKSGSNGRKPKDERAVVYLTWRRIDKSKEWEKPGKDDINEVAKSVYNQVKGKIDLSKTQIVNGLQPLKSPQVSKRKIDRFKD